MADVQETKGFLARARVEGKALSKKIENAQLKIAECRAALADNESLQAFLHEQIEEMEEA